MDNLPVAINSNKDDAELAKLNSMGFANAHEYQLYLTIMKSLQKPVVIEVAS